MYHTSNKRKTRNIEETENFWMNFSPSSHFHYKNKYYSEMVTERSFIK